jgi:peptidoglycan/xylan/chitin deacetylase (PgdA/CDA1 family)
MLDQRITKVKVAFGFMVLLFVSAIVFAVSEHAARSLTFAVEQELRYLSYRWEFNENGASTLAGAYGFITNPLNATVNTETATEAVPVLVYHRIPKEADGANVTLDTFKEHLATLHDRGWQTVTLADFHSFLRGEKTLPERSFVLTFDDGARASYYPVDPLLRVFGYHAVTFILPQYSLHSKTTYYVSQDDLENMTDSGRWEIGSHGFDAHAHIPINSSGEEAPYLGNRAWLPQTESLESLHQFATRVEQDLERSKAELEDALGISVTAFAYPFGDFGQRSRNYAGAEAVLRATTVASYPIAFAQIDTETRSVISPLSGERGFMVRRLKVDPTWSGDDLIHEMGSIVNASSFPYRQ